MAERNIKSWQDQKQLQNCSSNKHEGFLLTIYSYLSYLVILGDPDPHWHIQGPWRNQYISVDVTILYNKQPSIRATTIRVHGIIKTPGSRRTLDPREVGERQTCKPPNMKNCGRKNTKLQINANHVMAYFRKRSKPSNGRSITV